MSEGAAVKASSSDLQPSAEGNVAAIKNIVQGMARDSFIESLNANATMAHTMIAIDKEFDALKTNPPAWADYIKTGELPQGGKLRTYFDTLDLLQPTAGKIADGLAAIGNGGTRPVPVAPAPDTHVAKLAARDAAAEVAPVGQSVG